MRKYLEKAKRQHHTLLVALGQQGRLGLGLLVLGGHGSADDERPSVPHNPLYSHRIVQNFEE